MKLNSVVTANRAMPTHNSSGNTFNISIPANSIHITHLEAKLTTGTNAAPVEIAPAMPKVQPYALPLDALMQIAQDSGLMWVNSDSAKVAQVQAAIAAEPQPVHVPRERPAATPQDERPLILVETKRDLRHIELPFERTDKVE